MRPLRPAAVLVAVAALTLLTGCGGGKGGAASSTTTTTAGGLTSSTRTPVGEIPAQSADPTATDTENAGRSFARLYSVAVKQQAKGAVDDTQTACIEDQLIATFGGSHLLELANTTYQTMPPADLAKLVQVLQGCGLTQPTLELVGVVPSTTSTSTSASAN